MALAAEVPVRAGVAEASHAFNVDAASVSRQQVGGPCEDWARRGTLRG
jgi:hypothetical protein